MTARILFFMVVTVIGEWATAYARNQAATNPGRIGGQNGARDRPDINPDG